MKTKNFWTRFPIVSASIVTAMVLLSACDKDDDDTAVNNTPYTISGNGTGAQVVPAVSGTGTSTITGSYDPATNMFNYTSNWNGLTGAPSSGGLYNGASGSTGTAVGTPWTFANGSTGTGSYTGSMTLTSDQASQLTNGGWYYSYGTTANPGGEVRGQIAATR